jgi:hypothetical protein
MFAVNLTLTSIHVFPENAVHLPGIHGIIWNNIDQYESEICGINAPAYT